MTARLSHRFDPQGEEGATLAIVAVSLVAILGMVVLTVDLGALLVKRRGMVNAGDAGALAAAETFAEGVAQPGTNEGPAQAQADSLATQNVANAVRDSFSVGPFPDPMPPLCAGDPTTSPCGSVTVRYHGNQSLFFAPLFGVGQTDVHADAKAVWGPAGGGHVAPILVTLPGWQSCHFPPGPAPTPPPRCSLGYDPSDLRHSQWGVLDLGNWNMDPSQDPKQA